MFLNRFLLFSLLLLPLQAWSAYDADKIKTGIKNKNDVFKVSQWVQSSNEQHWTASTTLKRVKITVGENQAKFIAPFINPQQIKSAKILCEEFTIISTQSIDEESRQRIKEIIRAATTRHQAKYLTINHVKFSVTPKLIGSVVSLTCSAKAM